MKELREKTIKELRKVKENLKNNYDEKNYCDMINGMIDYDNESQDNLYLYDNVMEYYNFIDNELLEQYIASELKEYGVERIRYILGDTVNSEIYILDAYGNLENVNDGMFEDCIDQAIETLEKAIAEDEESEDL